MCSFLFEFKMKNKIWNETSTEDKIEKIKN